MSAWAAMEGRAALAPSLALNLTLGADPRAAAARVEIHHRAGGRVGWVGLRGSLGRSETRRVRDVLERLADLGCRRLLVDWSSVRHVDYRAMPELAAALRRFEARLGGVALCGVSCYLRDLIRLSGYEPAWWPSAAELLSAAGSGTEVPVGESAS